MTDWQYIAEVLIENTDEAFKDGYLDLIPAVNHLKCGNPLTFSSPVTFFVGENGTGKSTLLEAIAVAFGFNPEGGTVNFTFSTNSSHSCLYEHLTLKKRRFAKDGFFLRAESVYNLASNIDEIRAVGSYGGVSLHNQSHGESFMSIVQNRFLGKGLYILDEPEAALSPGRQLTLLAEIDRLVKDNSQFIVATHSPILMAYPGAEIFMFSKNGIIRQEYKETEHYKITKEFLNSPERMLKYLLKD